MAADDVNAEQLVVPLVPDQLHEPFLKIKDPSLAEHRQGEAADPDLVPARLGDRLGEADAGDLGIAEGAVGDLVVVDRLRLAAGDRLRRDDPFMRRGVGVSRCRDQVADGVDRRIAGAHPGVDLHVTPIELDLGSFEAETVGERAPPDGHQKHLGLERLGSPFLGADLHLDPLGADLHRLDLRPDTDLDAALAERLLHLRGNLLIFQRQDTRQHLDHGHGAAETAVDRGEFDADRARSQDDQAFRNELEPERLVAGDDPRSVDFQIGEHLGDRAGRQEDVPGGDRLRAAGPAAHFDLFRPLQSSDALHDGDAVLLHQKFDAFGLTADDVALVLVDAGQVERHSGGLDPEARRRAGRLENFGAVKQRLGRNAADMKAGAAEGRVFLHQGGLESQLRGANRRDIAAGTAADDGEIERLLRFGHLGPPLARSCAPGPVRDPPGRKARASVRQASVKRGGL